MIDAIILGAFVAVPVTTIGHMLLRELQRIETITHSCNQMLLDQLKVIAEQTKVEKWALLHPGFQPDLKATLEENKATLKAEDDTAILKTNLGI